MAKRLTRIEDISIETYITDLRKRQGELEAKLLLLRGELEETERLIAKFNPDYFQIDVAGLSIKQALEAIARKNDGVLLLSAARPILLDAKFFKNERNAITSISSVLSKNAHIFKRVGKGIYRLATK